MQNDKKIINQLQDINDRLDKLEKHGSKHNSTYGMIATIIASTIAIIVGIIVFKVKWLWGLFIIGIWIGLVFAIFHFIRRIIG